MFDMILKLLPTSSLTPSKNWLLPRTERWGIQNHVWDAHGALPAPGNHVQDTHGELFQLLSTLHLRYCPVATTFSKCHCK